MGLPYDSDYARNIGAALCSLMTGYSYYTSALMAEKVGPFPCYKTNEYAMNRVIRNHARAASCSEVSVFYEDLPAGELYGYRNAQVTVLAPTGTIAFAMDCATTSFYHILANGYSLNDMIVDYYLKKALA